MPLPDIALLGDLLNDCTPMGTAIRPIARRLPPPHKCVCFDTPPNMSIHIDFSMHR